MNHLPSLNAFNLSKDFIFFRLFLFFFSSSVQRKFLKKKKKKKERRSNCTLGNWWTYFFIRRIFLPRIFPRRYLEEKKKKPLFPSKEENHTSREFDVIETFERNFSPSHSPPFLIVDARTYVIVRNDPPHWKGNFTAGFARLEFSLLSRSLASFYRTENRKEKDRKGGCSIRNKPPSLLLLDEARSQIREIPSTRQ